MSCQRLTGVFGDEHGAEAGGAGQTQEAGHAFPPPGPEDTQPLVRADLNLTGNLTALSASSFQHFVEPN